jgi:RNA polymerase sigma factor (sigma-70 family)
VGVHAEARTLSRSGRYAGPRQPDDGWTSETVEQRNNGLTDQRNNGFYGVGDIGQDADQFLVEQIRTGDEDAWRQLIGRYEGRLAAFARTRLRSRADVDDAVQETFLGFLQSLDRYDENRSLETYLFAIVRYKIGDICRRKRLPTPADFGHDAEQGGDVLERAGTGETPSFHARRRESLVAQQTLIAEGLRRLIREYAEKDRFRDLQIVELSFYVGMRNKDIGAKLGVDEKAVAGVKFRAIHRLRDVMESEIADADIGTIEDLTDEASVARIWRERRLSCLKRSTLGAYLLGVLEEPWAGYTRFHLEDVKCAICNANLDDLASDADARETARRRRDQAFVSSVGFLRSTRSGG